MLFCLIYTQGLRGDFLKCALLTSHTERLKKQSILAPNLRFSVYPMGLLVHFYTQLLYDYHQALRLPRARN